jgi:beta-glucanase (GH16 family)
MRVSLCCVSVRNKFSWSSLFLAMSLAFVLSMLATPAAAQTWSLAWSDEFNAGGNADVNSADWTHETGGGGFGNAELEYYQAGNLNCKQDAGGFLNIQARMETVGTNHYTSCRIKTSGKKTFGPPTTTTSFKMEGRAQGPMSQGTWPAFWMLGDNINSGQSWPGCGEIDIMEHINTATTVPTTLHFLNGTTQGAGTYVTSGLPAPTNTTFTAWHTYAFTWSNSNLQFWLDGNAGGNVNILNNAGGTDEFHRPFFLLLNMAIGGSWPGSPNSSTVFPSNFNIDYVRWYTSGAGATPTSTTPPTATPTNPPNPTPTTPPTATPTTNPGGTLLSQGKPATASSVQTGNTAANGNDGSTTTRWAAVDGTFPQWWRVDLGASSSLSQVAINWFMSSSRSYKYKIEVSSDGTNFTTAVDKSGNTAMGDTTDNLSTSGRYVRITVTGSSAGFASFYECKVLGGGAASTPTPTTPPTAVLLSQGHPVVASGAENAGTAAANAVDGSTTTRWSSTFVDPSWIYVDLGASHAISKVGLNWETAYAKSYQVQTSNDAVNWTNVFTTTAGAGGNVSLTVSGSGRYVRMFGTLRATQYGYSLWEFQVFGN